MASRKLTQLPTATEVTASDKIYIVDVSDTSESPQGTSKQAVISELPSSGITSLTSTDGSIAIDLTDPSAPDLSANKIQSVLGANEVSFRALSGDGLRAVFSDANFEAPITINKNDSGVIRMGFYAKGSNPTARPAAIPNATDEASAITAVNSILAAMRSLGLIAE